MKFVFHMDPLVTRPFKRIGGGDTGVVLIHGLNSTPYEMNHVARLLSEEGCSVHSIRLPGHAGHPNDLLGVTWQDWVETTRGAVEELRATCSKVVLIGQCAGGVLGLYVSTLVPVEAVFLTAPVLTPNKKAERLIPLLRVMGKRYHTWRPTEEEMEGVEWFGYFTQPISVHAEFIALQRATWARLDRIESHVVIIRSEEDKLISKSEMDTLFGLAGAEVELVEIPGNAHIMTLNEAVKDEVIGAIVSRIRGRYPPSARELAV